MVPCELLAVTITVGNNVANSLEPKKLRTNATVAMNVSPCLNGFTTMSRVIADTVILGHISELWDAKNELMRSRFRL